MEEHGSDEYHHYSDDYDTDYHVLERVKLYITSFYQKFHENKVSEVKTLYYKEWSQLTKDYYKDVEWPRTEEISSLCNHDEVFLLCYNELSYRHIMVNHEPQIHHRFESWNNYRELFDMFLQGNEAGALMLPAEWLNDMIDEFLYQFQDFCRYKHEIKSLSSEEITLLKENPNVWKTETVLGYLTSFVQRSSIVELLDNSKTNSGRMTLVQSMGYFSLFGLCRLHTLIGDYRLAIKVLEPIDIDDKRAFFTRVTSCHITLFYYLGFSYLMMKRYYDAINVFSAVLLAYRGTKDKYNSYGDSQIVSKLDKTRSLTAMAMALSPGARVDQQVKYLIEEKFSSENSNLMSHDADTYANMFFHACPKFIVPGTPNFDGSANSGQQTFLLQRKWFLQEVGQQRSLTTIRSYLKLYTSIPIEKLARFCGMSQEVFKENLLSLKYAANQNVHTENSSPLDSKRVAVNDIHFYIVGEMVFIDETRAPQRYSQYFLTHAFKFQQAIDDMSELKKKR